jgi:DMSO/TMAO reductase YedYZ molybdopterin-dependent catalytic subunit
MPHPWVNTLLLGFVAIALVSGYFGLTNGDPGRAWVLWVHGAVAFAILAVLAWKAAVVARSLRSNRVLGTPRMAFLVMAALLVFVLGSGLTWAHAGRVVLGPVSLIEMHQWAAVAVAALLAWHVLLRRSILRLPPAHDRRAFLRLAFAGTGGLVLWQGAELLTRLTGLPGADRRFTGSYETGSFTGFFPRVSWFNDDPAVVAPDTWELAIDGLVDHEQRLDYFAVSALPQAGFEATLDCTGGWYSTQRWSGVRVAALLEMAGPSDSAGSIEVQSVTGYSRRFSMAESDSALLALSVAGRPLTHSHGAPARLVVPDHRGFDWVKWVTRITVHAGPDVWQPPLPLQ